MIRRALGVAILVLCLTPLHRLLLIRDTGLAGQANAEIAGMNLRLAWWGLTIVVGTGVVGAIFLPTALLRRLVGKLGDLLVRPSARVFAPWLALLAAALAAVVGGLLQRGFLTNVDEMVSLIHARYLAAGTLGGELGATPAAWLLPNTLVTDAGWVSQYPPFHLGMLALGVAVGAPWLVGPASVAVMVGLSVPVAQRLLPADARTARLGALLVALSPFILFLGGGALSHVSAGALALVTLYAVLRARDGGWGWAVLAGAATGALVASRPWTGVVLGVTFPVACWLFPLFEAGRPAGFARRSLGWLGARAAGTVAGGLPFAVGLGWYQTRVFGHPLTTGYLAAYGERHLPGLHRDPWGYPYGVFEALGYTAADLSSFGVQLLETPLPATVLVGLFLILARSLEAGHRVLIVWALAPVAANALYWFHSPRLLYEAAPAWLILVAVAATKLAGEAERRGALRGGWGGRIRRRVSDGLLWAFVASVALALVWLVPARARSYRWDDETVRRVTALQPPTPGPALVFVHASWNERLASRLQAAGMRSDSINAVLRRNDVCALERYVVARERAGAVLPSIDVEQVPGTPPGLETMAVSPDNRVRVDPSAGLTEDCRRNLRADRFGTVSLAPLAWQGDLPGIEAGLPLFVRDLGPAANAEILRRYADRSVWLFGRVAPEAPLALTPYEEGMTLLWGAREP